jgi:transcriptional regulator with XRE-family HTH domain
MVLSSAVMVPSVPGCGGSVDAIISWYKIGIYPVSDCDMPQQSLARERIELTDFLRSRRQRLSPESVGLPVGGRRRTAGLRREEVAALAGVGLTWYTWFEQGRDIGVSPGFLDNVARALRLSGTERSHLYTLADHGPDVAAPPSRPVSPALQRMLDGFATYPAYLKTPRWDVVAWNAPADEVFGIAHRDPDQRNILEMVFAEPEFRERMVNWRDDAPKILAKFRADYARRAGDPAMAALVESLMRHSAEFRLWWQRHDVMPCGEGVKVITVPGRGAVAFEHTSFEVATDPDLRLVVYAPLPD